MAKHSPTGASSMHRWGECPGSIKLISQVPEQAPSSFAQLGTNAHKLAESALRAKNFAREYIGKKVFDFEVDEEMANAVQVYLDYVSDLVGVRHIEYQFDVSEKLGVEGAYGTADFIAYSGKNKELHVVDYKHGAGYPVEVKDNKQLKYYALGAMLSLDLPVSVVHSTIVQPRSYHPNGPIRTETYKAVELVEFSADLVEAIEATRKDGAILKAGDHCKFCPAHAVCPEFNNRALSVAKVEFSPAKNYDPIELRNVLNWLPALKAYIQNVENFAYQEAVRGRIPPNYKLVQKRSTRKWVVSKAKELAAALGVKADDLYAKKLMTPAQAEKKFKDKKDLITEMVKKESSGLTLVPDYDTRLAVVSDAKSEFETADLFS